MSHTSDDSDLDSPFVLFSTSIVHASVRLKCYYSPQSAGLWITPWMQTILVSKLLLKNTNTYWLQNESLQVDRLESISSLSCRWVVFECKCPAIIQKIIISQCINTVWSLRSIFLLCDVINIINTYSVTITSLMQWYNKLPQWRHVHVSLVGLKVLDEVGVFYRLVALQRRVDVLPHDVVVVAHFFAIWKTFWRVALLQ